MTSTVVSWALTLSLVGVGVYYYRPDLVSSFTQQSPQTISSSSDHSVPSVGKKLKPKKTQLSKFDNSDVDSVPSSSNEAQTSKKRKIAAKLTNAPTDIQHLPNNSTGGSGGGSTDIGDREFAQQLARAQVGTNFKRSDEAKSKKKSKAQKQSQAKTFEEPFPAAQALATTEDDAGDDSSTTDAALTAAYSDRAKKAGDFSDMLEAPAVKPTTLRLTSIPDEDKNKKKPKAQPFEQVLTKKQRQAQARKEEMRQMKEESDRIHEAKKQEQLRKARMAAGTSNQTKANNFSAGASNVWQSGSGQVAVKSAPTDNAAPLLDTFEPQRANVSQSNGAVHTKDLSNAEVNDASELRQQLGSQKASAVAASDREAAFDRTSNSWTGNVSEEDQMKLLKEQQAEDAWESVSSKKSRKKTKTDVDTGSDASSTAQPAVSVSRAQTNGSNPNGASKQANTTNNRFGSFQVPRVDGLTDAEWEA